MTVDKTQRASLAGQTVFIEYAHGPWWDQAWVFPKRQTAIEGQARAQTFYKLLASTSVAEVKQVISSDGGEVDGRVSYRWVRSVMAEYTLLVRKGDQIFDCHRDFQIHAVSEQWLWLMIKLGKMSHTYLAGSKAPGARPPTVSARARSAALVAERAATPKRRPIAPPLTAPPPALLTERTSPAVPSPRPLPRPLPCPPLPPRQTRARPRLVRHANAPPRGEPGRPRLAPAPRRTPATARRALPASLFRAAPRPPGRPRLAPAPRRTPATARRPLPASVFRAAPRPPCIGCSATLATRGESRPLARGRPSKASPPHLNTKEGALVIRFS